MYVPEHEDIVLLHNALQGFGPKFVDKQGAEKLRDFQLSLSPDERAQVERATKLIEDDRSSDAPVNERMASLLFNFATLLPGMRKEFGDAAVLDALDPKVTRTSVVNLCDYVGAREVAQFFRENRGMRP